MSDPQKAFSPQVSIALSYCVEIGRQCIPSTSSSAGSFPAFATPKTEMAEMHDRNLHVYRPCKSCCYFLVSVEGDPSGMEDMHCFVTCRFWVLNLVLHLPEEFERA
jgi:hypothetical protein